MLTGVLLPQTHAKTPGLVELVLQWGFGAAASEASLLSISHHQQHIKVQAATSKSNFQPSSFLTKVLASVSEISAVVESGSLHE
jgi:hypothetical protein